MSNQESWKNDDNLKKILEGYVQKRYSRAEILDFISQDFCQYKWSIRSLDRRLKHFNIRYINYNVPLQEIETAVDKELSGPGRLLGYRAMTQKIRQNHGLNVPRDLVYNVMTLKTPALLEARLPPFKRANKVKRAGHFTTRGVYWFHSLDGHDKLMGFRNSTFPLAIYGCIDTASRKLLWIRCWTSNSDPRLPARWYIEHLLEEKTIASNIRLDKGTETGKLATIHAYLRGLNENSLNDPTSTVYYGPSTSNQVLLFQVFLDSQLC